MHFSSTFISVKANIHTSLSSMPDIQINVFICLTDQVIVLLNWILITSYLNFTAMHES
jgi:hypothetical protein